MDGFKNEYGKDKPIEVRTNGWEKISNLELLKLIKLFADNEEVIYPRNKGMQGKNKIKKAIFQIFEGKLSVEEIVAIGNKKGVYENDYKFDPKEWTRVWCDRCGGEVICADDSCGNKFIWGKIK